MVGVGVCMEGVVAEGGTAGVSDGEGTGVRPGMPLLGAGSPGRWEGVDGVAGVMGAGAGMVGEGVGRVDEATGIGLVA